MSHHSTQHPTEAASRTEQSGQIETVELVDISEWTGRDRRKGTRRVLVAVQSAFDATSDWDRQLREIGAEATKAKKSRDALQGKLQERPGLSPRQALANFDAADVRHTAGLRNGRGAAGELVGSHGYHLFDSLQRVADEWPSPVDEDERVDDERVAQDAHDALEAVTRVTEHALILKLLEDLIEQRPGKRFDYDKETKDWQLKPADIERMWKWLLVDVKAMRFGGRSIPVVIDEEDRCLYRRPTGIWRAFCAAAPLWGAALSYWLAVLVVFLAHKRNILDVHKDWLVDMVILFGCVAGGAVVHVGSRALSGINYGDRLTVRPAEDVVDWLSLRWLSILSAYIPVSVITVALWAAGTMPATKPPKTQDLLLAFLAGYSADSGLRNLVADAKNLSAKLGNSKGGAEGSEAKRQQKATAATST